ncbi:MAG: DUF4197 domain-containing protein [Fibromonadales bacterium]|nr:DUF4197 domain-containing protein [Fibromonadales bacterium]
MRKILLACSFVLLSCGLHDMQDIFPLDNGITEDKMVGALKEALVLGSRTAALNLGDGSCTSKECVTGYLGNKLVEIALPDTVGNVLKKVSTFTSSLNSLPTPAKTIIANAMPEYSSIFNLGEYGDSIKVALNRGAEKAAPKSVDVFKNAISGMSFSDAKGLLQGDSVAATTYLNVKTYDNLQVAFAPIIKEPLDLLKPNNFWKPLASNYNSFVNAYSKLSSNTALNTALAIGNSSLPKLPYNALPDDISSLLSEYATGKALDGLFLMVGKQETKLRADPLGAVKAVGDLISDSVGDLLGDVFGKAKEGLL